MGYVAYKVNDDVTSHEAYGVGVYSYFRDHPVDVKAGIIAPPLTQVNFVDSVTVFLNGEGAIDHVIDSEGDAVRGNGQTAYVCNYNANTVAQATE